AHRALGGLNSGFDALLGQSRLADRSDRGDDDPVAESSRELAVLAELLRQHEEMLDLGRARERHNVDLALEKIADQPNERPVVLRERQLVQRNVEHGGAPRAESLVQDRAVIAVELDRDELAEEVVADQRLHDAFGGRLPRGQVEPNARLAKSGG